MPDHMYNDEFLRDLLDHPSEQRDVEYKRWMDLSMSENKAKIAKHLCALSNFGGGWLVFGVNDDYSYAEPHPGALDGYNRDVINGIVERYLTPPFHCQVFQGQCSITDNLYPVILVPPHGSTPVCAKANGPQDGNGKIVGVKKGVHYTRAPGPKSVPLDGPELWREVIHRCVVNERDGLLSSIGRLFDRPTVTNFSPPLEALLTTAEARWDALVPSSGALIDLKSNKVVFAFQLLTERDLLPGPKQPRDLLPALTIASNAADGAVRTGWPFFSQMHSDQHRPKVGVWDEVEYYEAGLIESSGSLVSIPTLWRALVDGRGFEVRQFREDSAWVIEAVNQRKRPGWVAGQILVPSLQFRDAFQFVVFARELATRFPDAVTIQLGVAYSGLDNRDLAEAQSGRAMSRDYSSVESGRRVAIRSSVESLAGDGAIEAAIRLVSPVLRLFDGFEVRPEHASAWLRD